MNRKALIVLGLIVLTLAGVAPAVTHAQDTYEIELPRNDWESHHISASQSVALSTYWSYCRAPGAANLFKSAYFVGATLDGEMLLDGSVQAAQPYWGEPWQTTDNSIWCNPNEAPEYAVEWIYEIGQLSPGEHTLEINVGLNHRVTDLTDLNWAGKPSMVGPITFTWTTTITVTP